VWGQEHHRGRVEPPTIAGPVDRWVEGLTQGISEVSQLLLSPLNAFSGFCGPVFWTIGPNTPLQGKSPPQAVFLRRREVSPFA